MLYVIAHDTMFRRDEDTGIRVLDDEKLVRDLLLTLHRGSTSKMYRTERVIPTGCIPAIP
jgi:hypothetical protein